jgi:hypothetical protein
LDRLPRSPFVAALPMTTLHAVLACALLASGIAGCREAQDRVTRVSSPSDEYWFVTHCKHHEQCLRDAREMCPHGFVKTPERGQTEGVGDFYFKCHGKADW